MASCKIFTIFFVLISIQCVFGKPVEYSAEEIESAVNELKANLKPSEKLILFSQDDFLIIPEQLTHEAVNACQYLLKDEILVNNNKPEILELKKNLTIILDKHKPKITFEAMELFLIITDTYHELTEDQVTPESKIISDLLKKYNFRKIAIKIDIVEMAMDEMRENGSGTEKLLVFTLDNFLAEPLKYAANAANASEYLLKDEALVGNQNPEMLQFKRNLTTLLDNYDKAVAMQTIYETLDKFANITEHYYKIPEDKVTMDQKCIIDLLNKYDCKKVTIKFATLMRKFFDEFTKMFEENKNDLEKPLLEWYEKYKNLTDVKARLKSSLEFLGLAKSK